MDFKNWAESELKNIEGKKIKDLQAKRNLN